MKTAGDQAAGRRVARARRAVLAALAEIGEAAGAARVSDVTSARGIELQPRAIRYHLAAMDREGMTRLVSRRRGRVLTERGRDELARGDVLAKLGFVAARMDDLAYRMCFDPASGTGTVIANVAWLDAADLTRALALMEPAFLAGLGMGDRIAVAHEGDRIACHVVPAGRVALGTICSVTLNGILLKAGIPVASRFGGLLEMRGGRPLRFVELIEYRGTTIDPLDVFMRAGLTSVSACARTGDGLVGASLREAPSAAMPDLHRIARRLRALSLPALLTTGRPDQPLFQIPVTGGHAALLVMGGLNPVAVLREAGMQVDLGSLAGLEDIRRFRPVGEARLGHRRESPLID